MTVRRPLALAVLLPLALAGCALTPPGLQTAVPAPAPSSEATPTSVPTASASASSARPPLPEPTATWEVAPATASASAASAPASPQATAGQGTSRGGSASRGPNTTDRVVLTYDDCPTSLAAFKQTVTGAEALGVRIVLFPLGTCVQQGKIDVDFARQHGMFVYSHSVSHPEFTKLSDAAIRKQLAPPAVQGTYVRPPYGATNKHVAQVIADAGMKTWLWSLDTEDWRKKPQEQVVSLVTTQAKAGDTVLMHMQWHAFNTDAIAQMKSGLEARGIALCRVDGPATATGPFSC